MKCKLSDICSFRKGKVEVENLNAKNYISTENMLPNKCGITEAKATRNEWSILTHEQRYICRIT